MLMYAKPSVEIQLPGVEVEVQVVRFMPVSLRFTPGVDLSCEPLPPTWLTGLISEKSPGSVGLVPSGQLTVPVYPCAAAILLPRSQTVGTLNVCAPNGAYAYTRCSQSAKKNVLFFFMGPPRL